MNTSLQLCDKIPCRCVKRSPDNSNRRRIESVLTGSTKQKWIDLVIQLERMAKSPSLKHFCYQGNEVPHRVQRDPSPDISHRGRSMTKAIDSNVDFNESRDYSTSDLERRHESVLGKAIVNRPVAY